MSGQLQMQWDMGGPDFPSGIPTHTSVHNPEQNKFNLLKFTNNAAYIPPTIYGQGDNDDKDDGGATNNNLRTTNAGGGSRGRKATQKSPSKPSLANVDSVVEFCKEENYGPGSSALNYTFIGSFDIRNVSEQCHTLLFKVKTTSPEKFTVNQILGVIPPWSKASPKIVVRPDTVLWTISRERFQVLLMKAPSELLEQNILLSKLILRNSQGGGGGGGSGVMSSKLLQLWNKYVDQDDVHMESHRVDCSLSPHNYHKNNNNKKDDTDSFFYNEDNFSNKYKISSKNSQQGPSKPRLTVDDDEVDEFSTPIIAETPPDEPASTPSKTEGKAEEEMITHNIFGQKGGGEGDNGKYNYDKLYDKNLCSCSGDGILKKVKNVERRIDDLMHNTALRFCCLKKLIFLSIVLLTIFLSYVTILWKKNMETENDIEKTTVDNNYVGCDGGGGELFMNGEKVEGHVGCGSIPSTTIKQFTTWNRYYV